MPVLLAWSTLFGNPVLAPVNVVKLDIFTFDDPLFPMTNVVEYRRAV
mgnify:CR=1 FL=1